MGKTRSGERRPEGQVLFGIVQGGRFVDLRQAHGERARRATLRRPRDRKLSVGEPIERMGTKRSPRSPSTRRRRPRYLMGVGSPRISARHRRRGHISTASCRRATLKRSGLHAIRAHHLKNARWQRDRGDRSTNSAVAWPAWAGTRAATYATVSCARDPLSEAPLNPQPLLVRRSDPRRPPGHSGRTVRELARRFSRHQRRG